MKRLAIPLLLALGAPALAVPGGPIGQIPPGNFQCELPGDATGAVGLRVPDEDFAVVNANTYRTAKGRGTYLLTGDLLALTSGPKNGDRYRLISNNFLRKLGADGQDGSLRCVRRVVNNS